MYIKIGEEEEEKKGGVKKKEDEGHLSEWLRSTVLKKKSRALEVEVQEYTNETHHCAIYPWMHPQGWDDGATPTNLLSNPFSHSS